jgi:hypothetical protein
MNAHLTRNKGRLVGRFSTDAKGNFRGPNDRYRSTGPLEQVDRELRPQAA